MRLQVQQPGHLDFIAGRGKGVFSSTMSLVFKLQKRAIRIIMNSHSWTSRHELFKELNILPLQSQYILSLAVFVVKNIDDFTITSDIHSINTRHRLRLAVVWL
jgi:hypothetical protein